MIIGGPAELCFALADLNMGFKALLTSVLLATVASAQLSGSVGPTTPLSQKSHICSVLDYGGSVGSSDIGPAITSAFNVSELLIWGHMMPTHSSSLELRPEEFWVDPVCARRYVDVVTVSITSAVLLKPARAVGNYQMQTWVDLKGGTKWAFRLDGFITRTGVSTMGRELVVDG